MNNSAPDSQHLNDHGSIDFNEALLRDPDNIESNSFLQEAARDDPSLPMLSPLSRLLFYRNTSDVTDYLFECLDSTHIAIYEEENKRPTSESVHFKIDRVIEGSTYSLQFKSTADLI